MPVKTVKRCNESQRDMVSAQNHIEAMIAVRSLSASVCMRL